jgi:hypothetical protein
MWTVYVLEFQVKFSHFYIVCLEFHFEIVCWNSYSWTRYTSWLWNTESLTFAIQRLFVGSSYLRKAWPQLWREQTVSTEIYVYVSLCSNINPCFLLLWNSLEGTAVHCFKDSENNNYES